MLVESRMRGNVHVRFGGRKRGNGAGVTRSPRLLPTRHVKQSPEEAEVLFTLIAERYERRSTLITSNLVFSDWERIFKDPMATAAAIDRLVHHAAILEFNVASYRTRKTRRSDTGQAADTADTRAG